MELFCGMNGEERVKVCLTLKHMMFTIYTGGVVERKSDSRNQFDDSPTKLQKKSRYSTLSTFFVELLSISLFRFPIVVISSE